jgi:hypothetical protein
MSSSSIKVLLYPSLGKRGNLPARSRFGEGRGEILQEYFKIPLYPPLPKGDKKNVIEGLHGKEV